MDKQAVIEGFADAIWWTGWADAVERAVEDGELAERDNPIYAGAEISEVAPETPDKALAIAKREVHRMERSMIDRERGAMTLVEAYNKARGARYDAPEDEEAFGFLLGMQWLGTGVGLPHEARGWDTGHGEINVYLEDGDPDSAEIDYESGGNLSGVGDHDVGSWEWIEEKLRSSGFRPLGHAQAGKVVLARGYDANDVEGARFVIPITGAGDAADLRSLVGEYAQTTDLPPDTRERPARRYIIVHEP